MKKLLCLVAVLVALLAVLVIDLVRGPGGQDDGSVELAGRVATVSRPATAPQRSSSSSAAELQRVIRQDVE